MAHKSLKLFGLLSFIVIIFSILIISSCQKKEFEDLPSGIPDYSGNETNLALQELTDIFLAVTSSESFRKELKSDALLVYADDYLLKQTTLKNGEIDNQILKLLKNYLKDSEFKKLQKLITKIPNYEVSIPVNAEEWDEKNYQPLIAFVPIDFNDKIHKRIKAFDNSGKKVWLSTETDPEIPIILIRPKEDIDLSKYRPDNGINLKSRTNMANEFIKEIGTNNIHAVESWLTGPRCEIKVITIASKTKSIISTDFFNPLRRDIKNKYKTVNHKVDIWNKDIYGQYWTMQWFEEDGGNTVTISVNYKMENGATSSISYTIKDDDDNLGLKTIHFSDYVGMEYNTGRIKWRNNSSVYCPYMGSWDGVNCYVGTAPSGTTAFLHNNKFYYTPLSGNQCPLPGSWFDGVNCFVSYIPTEANPFIWNNKWYVEPYNF